MTCPACKRPVIDANEAAAYRMHEDCWALYAARCWGDYIPVSRETERLIAREKAGDRDFGGRPWNRERVRA